MGEAEIVFFGLFFLNFVWFLFGDQSFIKNTCVCRLSKKIKGPSLDPCAPGWKQTYLFCIDSIKIINKYDDFIFSAKDKLGAFHQLRHQVYLHKKQNQKNLCLNEVERCLRFHIFCKG